MEPITLTGILVKLLLLTGAVASISFVVTYIRTANLKSKVARQQLTLNIAIAAVLVLAIVSRLGLRFGFLTPELILYLQMFFFIFIDIALIYQLVMLRQAKRIARRRREDALESRK